MKSTIRLFKALPIEFKVTQFQRESQSLLRETVKRGFVFSGEVVLNYSERELRDLIPIIEKEIGLTAEQMNMSFHKSWAKVRDASTMQLILEQVVHYITTYGFDALGIYNENSIYIPAEKLEIPEIDTGKIKLTVIRGYTKEELKKKLTGLLGSGIALAEETIKDVIDVSLFVELTEKEIEAVRNKEVRAILYEYLDLIPENPVEFLRYLIYRTTETTLLIKSPELIEKIKGQQNMGVVKLFRKYDTQFGLEELAQIFYRFKPLWLAFRTNRETKRIINIIRRLAEKYHKPMPEDYLNTVTARIKNEAIDKDRLRRKLSKVNTFRKIRLAYALKFRTKDAESILYRVRNGKGYATDFEFKEKDKARDVLAIVLESIANDVSKNVKGKKIYTPKNIHYALPSTEKQFTGNFPSGAYVEIPMDMIFGIHWGDIPDMRIDLDLSLINPDGKIGWDSAYRTEDRNILFSGDITSAPNGATELFYVRKQAKEAHLLLVNFYNFEPNKEIPFKILVAREHADNLEQNYTVNPNNVIAIAKSSISKRQKILGLLVTTPTNCRFYFAETYVGCSITSSDSEPVDNTRKYLFDFYQDSIELREILEQAGAIITDDKENSDIDLSPENLEKDTILNLIK